MEIDLENQRARAIMQNENRAKVLLLGTFHFGNPGRDELNMTVNMMTEQRQGEISEVVSLLEAFRPTKVAVEWPLAERDELQRRYLAYRSGEFDLPPSEVFQVGFRLAARLGHEAIYPLDTWARQCDSEEAFTAFVSELGLSAEECQNQVYDPTWWRRFAALFHHNEELLASATVREYLALINSEEQIRLNHGVYLAWAASEPGDYRTADFMTGWWYNRNLRIYANLMRITESPEERILVIYGASHIPILRHCVEMSFLHELVPVSTVL